MTALTELPRLDVEQLDELKEALDLRTVELASVIRNIDTGGWRDPGTKEYAEKAARERHAICMSLTTAVAESKMAAEVFGVAILPALAREELQELRLALQLRMTELAAKLATTISPASVNRMGNMCQEVDAYIVEAMERL